MRALLLALALVACTPPAPEAPPPPPLSADAMSQPLIDALTPVIAADVNQPVTMTASQVRVMNEWGWIVAQPAAPGGGAIDWARTKYAGQAEAGALDGGGTTYALLKQENGQWRVLEFVVGPTDVAWLEWPARHGAPAEIIQ